MESIVVELDPQTGERARRLAHARGTTIRALVESLLLQLDQHEARHDPLLGLFADEPALLDHIVTETMQTRETVPLRYGDG